MGEKPRRTLKSLTAVEAPPRTTLTLEERGRQIAAKIAAGVRVPPAEAMRNSGSRRTESKRALLRLLDASKWSGINA